MAYLGFGARMQRKRKIVQEDIKISNYNGFFLQVSSCMYDFLASFCMHDICMWLYGNDLSSSRRIA